MATFDQFINSIIADGNDGKAFEKFCKHFLETSPEYAHQFEKVWLWDEWPNKWSHDKGIDLIAKYKDRDTYCAIQAKCYAAHNTVPYNEVTNFLADSSRTEIEDRILMMSTNKLNEKTSKEVISGQEKQVTILDRDYFENKAKFDYPAHISELGKAKAKPPATPFDHQKAAINDVEKGLQENDRGQLIMACGTGKTFTTLWIKERLKANTVLVLLPSLSLLSQTMREWVWGANERFDALAVCSDPTVGKSKKGDEDISTAEVGKVTWHVDEIQAFLKTPNRKVIFCTYQSSELIQLAQEDETIPQFDLVVCDEAHRCAGKANAGFATVLHEEKIRAKKRLFTTATPRYYGKSVQSTAEGRGVEIIGMDDEAKFGPVVHKLTFGQAIEMDMLTDYQVVVVGVDEPMVREWIAEGEIVSYGDENHTDARTLAAKIAVLKAIKDYDLKRVISFHTSINRAKEFASDVSDVAEVIDPDQRPKGSIWSAHVDGKMSAGKRRDLINSLKELNGHEIGLLTNARCLSEGVDVPTLDGVAFVDPRGSQVDIIQAVGRAIRKSDNKTKGTIVLPVFLEAGDDPDAVIDASNFKPVWDVLKALRAHDEVLADELDQYRTNIGLGNAKKSDRIDKVILDLPLQIDDTFSANLVVRLVEKVTNSWEFFVTIFQSYIENGGEPNIRADYVTDTGVKLGLWVAYARQRFTNLALSKSKIDQLEKTSGWFWTDDDARWSVFMRAMHSYVKTHKTSRVPQNYVDHSGFPLGKAVGTYRVKFTRGSLTKSQINELEALPFWVWNVEEARWSENYEKLYAFFKIYKSIHTTEEYHQECGSDLWSWLKGQKEKWSDLDPSKRRKLTELGADLSVKEILWEEKFNLLKEYCCTLSTSRVPLKYKTINGFGLGSWVNKQRSQRSLLSKRQIDKLETLPDWTWHTFKDAWDEKIKKLQAFYEINKHIRCEAGSELGKWCRKQRALYNKGKLAHERVLQLERFEFWSWDPKNKLWWDKHKAVIDYFNKNQSLPPSGYKTTDGLDLGAWIYVNKSNLTSLQDDRKKAFELILTLQ